MKRTYIVNILLGSLFVTTAIKTEQIDFLDAYLNKDPEFLELLNENNDTATDMIDHYMEPISTLKALPPFLIVQLLVTLGAVELLEQDFFLSTNRPARRSLLDWPIFEINTALLPTSFFNAQLFFNMTPRAHFTRTSSNIESYIATEDETLIGKIEAIINAIKEFTDGSVINLDIRSILDLVGEMTLVERNIGAMFQFGGRWDRLQLRIMMPLYYHERNVFLTPINRDALAKELGFSSETVFEEQFAIADRLGLGDTRVEFGIHAIESEKCGLILGVQTTLPTAFTIAKGLAGTTFKAPATYPIVDFETLYEAAEAAINHTITPEQQAAAFDIFQTFLFDAWNRIGAALLDNGLGNEGHVGLGAFALVDAPLNQWIHHSAANRWHWHNHLSVEFLFPKDTTRFYVNKNNPADFDRQFGNPEQAEENLLFLESKIIDRVNMLGLKTKVQPGVIANWTSNFVYTENYFSGYLGSNLWFQAREHHGSICAPRELTSTLDLQKSISSWAFQAQFLIGASYLLDRPTFTMALGLDADATAFTTGVGRDYTLAFHINTRF